MNQLLIEEQLRRFLIEDIGEGDVSSEAVIPAHAKGYGKIVAKEAGIIAGLDILAKGYHILDQAIVVHPQKKDGDAISSGETIAIIEGPYISLLAGERVLLNLVQRMSGIATMTNKAIMVLADKSIRICDTRKTTPGLRNLEKYAVRCGGGFNHRFGLNDAVMLKENHLIAGGGITRSVAAVRKRLGHMIKVEVETTNEREVMEAVEARVDVIMFDNATREQVMAYKKLVPNEIITEASGGITLETLPLYRGTGVDYISLGCLTHSVKAIDLSFLLEEGGL